MLKNVVKKCVIYVALIVPAVGFATTDCGTGYVIGLASNYENGDSTKIYLQSANDTSKLVLNVKWDIGDSGVWNNRRVNTITSALRSAIVNGTMVHLLATRRNATCDDIDEVRICPNANQCL
jgi:hypothetical protein